jgi:hypothetical protein
MAMVALDLAMCGLKFDAEHNSLQADVLEENNELLSSIVLKYFAYFGLLHNIYLKVFVKYVFQQSLLELYLFTINSILCTICHDNQLSNIFF